MRDHKSLIVWQRARALVDLVVQVSVRHWSPPASPYIHQLARSALSTQLNIAEGYARRRPRQTYYHLNVAYGSIVESIDLIEILGHHGLIPPELAVALMREATQAQALLLGLMRRYAAQCRDQG